MEHSCHDDPHSGHGLACTNVTLGGDNAAPSSTADKPLCKGPARASTHACSISTNAEVQQSCLLETGEVSIAVARR